MIVSTKYAHTMKCCCDTTMVWSTDTFKLALVTSAYTPSTAHTQWADVSTHEVAAGSGYTTGGVTLTNNTITNVGFFTDDLLFSSLTKTFRYGVIYKVGTANGLTNPLFCYILWNSLNIDKVISGIDFAVYIPATGLIRLL